jgi:hypothetical protein
MKQHNNPYHSQGSVSVPQALVCGYAATVLFIMLAHPCSLHLILYRWYSGITSYYIPLHAMLEHDSKTVMAYWFIIYVALTFTEHNH